MCVVTRERLQKQELFRVVRTPNKEIVLDETGKQNGKGAYLKKDSEVINKAQKHKILDKILEVSVPDVLYEEMLKIIKKDGENL